VIILKTTVNLIDERGIVLIKLRKLELKDVPFMLEWIQDSEISSFFQFDARSQTEEKIEAFIRDSWNEIRSIHLAVVDDYDEYLGTISLKNIDNVALEGEYAISLRKIFHGKGIADEATRAILEYAFKMLGLNRIYLNVLSNNYRAVGFYEKFGFVFERETRKYMINIDKYQNLRWYALMREEYQLRQCLTKK